MIDRYDFTNPDTGHDYEATINIDSGKWCEAQDLIDTLDDKTELEEMVKGLRQRLAIADKVIKNLEGRANVKRLQLATADGLVQRLREELDGLRSGRVAS